jgi:hypothetical protein
MIYKKWYQNDFNVQGYITCSPPRIGSLYFSPYKCQYGVLLGDGAHSHDSAEWQCQRKNYSVGPKGSSWPNILTAPPCDRPQVGPSFGPTR